MSNYHPNYRPASYKDGLLVLNKLRKEDRDEIEGMGLEPLHLPFGCIISEHSTFFHIDEEPAGVAGVVRLSPTEGQVWMLCTPLIEDNPHHFVRNSRRWLKEVEKDYSLLWNLADARNHTHHKLLKFLGFQALRSIPSGPDNLPYYEIVKLCA